MIAFERTLKIAMLGGLALLAGCQSYPDRPWYDQLNLQVDMPPRQEKKVQVAPSETSFALQFQPGKATVSDAERRAATAFIRNRASERSDEVYVDFGLMHETTALAHDRRATIAEIVTAAGFDPARVKVRADVGGIAESEVNLTVRRYLVTLPGCPDFTSPAGNTFNNRPNSNWGCATQTNLGLMVAEPHDIVVGRGGTPGDAEAMVLATQRYRSGETTPLPIKDTKTSDTFDAQKKSAGAGSGGGSQ